VRLLRDCAPPQVYGIFNRYVPKKYISGGDPMKQVLVRQGQAVVEEVPAPLVEPGTVLVRVERSCISVGTEMSGLRGSGVSLWRRALADPDKVRKALQMVATQGLSHTRSVVEGKLQAGSPTGYSAAGEVVEAGEGVDDLRPGDFVACAGAQYANHAEIVRVPRNLVVAVPRVSISTPPAP